MVGVGSCFYDPGGAKLQVGMAISRVHDTLRRYCPPQRTTGLSHVIYYRVLNRDRVSCCLNGSVVLSPGSRGRLRDVLSHLYGFRPVRCIRNATHFLKHAFQITPKILVPHPRARRLIREVLRRITPTSHVLSVNAKDKYVTIALSGRLPRTRMTT